MLTRKPDSSQLEMTAKFGRGVVMAHKASIYHRAVIEASGVCGCFYCCRQFAPDKIEEWVDNNTTALCPKCGIDSVIGSASGFTLSNWFLRRMRLAWFGP